MDTDHGFNMEKHQWQVLFHKMEEILPKIRSKLASFDLISTTSFVSS
jgi:hypothetical protein